MRRDDAVVPTEVARRQAVDVKLDLKELSDRSAPPAMPEHTLSVVSYLIDDTCPTSLLESSPMAGISSKLPAGVASLVSASPPREKHIVGRAHLLVGAEARQEHLGRTCVWPRRLAIVQVSSSSRGKEKG